MLSDKHKYITRQRRHKPRDDALRFELDQKPQQPRPQINTYYKWSIDNIFFPIRVESYVYNIFHTQFVVQGEYMLGQKIDVFLCPETNIYRYHVIFASGNRHKLRHHDDGPIL